MKKVFLLSILTFLILNSQLVLAKSKVLNFVETLEDEGITLLNPDYEETEKQATIYLFRGKECEHCFDFLEYLNSISEEKGHMFKLRSYELYNNEDNMKIKEKVANYFQETVDGVPYIIIGESTFIGYSDSINDKINQAIESEYNSNERFDVLDRISKKERLPLILNYGSLFLLIIGGGFIIFKIIKVAKSEN